MIVLQLHPRPEIWPIGWSGSNGIQSLFFVPPAEWQIKKGGVVPLNGDVTVGVDGNAVAILDGKFASDDVDFVIADGGDARADDAGAVGMGRGSGARPRRLRILILRILFFES